jgi:hypothetical protein
MIETDFSHDVATTTCTDDELVSAAQTIGAQNRERARTGTLRSDPHRPGAIQPHMYTSLGWYALASRNGRVLMAKVSAWMRTEEAIDFRAVEFGDWGKCGICGAAFVYGEVWQHQELLDVVHVGHDCAAKYKMTSGTNWTAIMAQREKTLKALESERKNRLAREQALAENPGLAAALAFDHYITKDIAARFEKYGTISPKQVALVMKLEREAGDREAAKQKRQAEQASEIHVSAPVNASRQAVQGVVVSVKEQVNDYGVRTVMTIKVTTALGSWLCWGTAPAAIKPSRGDVVRFDCVLQAGKEDYFAFIKRPTKAEIVSDSCEAA